MLIHQIFSWNRFITYMAGMVFLIGKQSINELVNVPGIKDFYFLRSLESHI